MTDFKDAAVFEPASVAELRCNLDDMTGEDIAFAQELLLQNGALDVWTSPIYMKKGRPAYELTCLCRAGEQERLAELMLLHTSTLGVRLHLCDRYLLAREETRRETDLGPLRVKSSLLPDGSVREKPEHDDLAAMARENDLSLEALRGIIGAED